MPVKPSLLCPLRPNSPALPGSKEAFHPDGTLVLSHPPFHEGRIGILDSCHDFIDGRGYIYIIFRIKIDNLHLGDVNINPTVEKVLEKGKIK
ncbi:MAG: hypothetical protein V3U52_01085 [Thermoplasmata archaeon]